MTQPLSLAEDLFQDMGRQVEVTNAGTNGTDDEQKVVEEIESLCMNCHENVSEQYVIKRASTNLTQGDDEVAVDEDTLLS